MTHKLHAYHSFCSFRSIFNPTQLTHPRKAPRASAGMKADGEGGRGNSPVFSRGGEQPPKAALRTVGSQSEDTTGVSPGSFTRLSFSSGPAGHLGIGSPPSAGGGKSREKRQAHESPLAQKKRTRKLWVLILDLAGEDAGLAVARAGKIILAKTWPSRGREAETLGAAARKVFRAAGISASHLGGLIVRSGLGSYTGLRIGASFANAFGFARNLPVVGVKLPVTSSPPASLRLLLEQGGPRIAKAHTFRRAVVPTYDLFTR